MQMFTFSFFPVAKKVYIPKHFTNKEAKELEISLVLLQYLVEIIVQFSNLEFSATKH